MEHHFNVGMAKEYGIEESILIHNLYYWIKHNVVNKKHFHDERYWTYNTADAFAQLFPYMNSSKIYRVLKSLEDKNIIIKGNYNEDKHDRTNWYSFANDALAILKENGYEIDGFSSSFQNDEMHFSKMENGICENAKCYNIDIDNIPNINTNDKHKEEDINISSKKNDYKAIIDCWNECNGKRLGKVTKVTQRRKAAIKKALLDNDITQEQLMQFFKTLPFADSWLYNPNKQHKNWKPDFDWWLANTNGWLTKGLEGKVHIENPQAYSSIISGEDAPYTPICEGSLSWNDYYKCYLYVGFWDGHFMPDGYTDENRPDGASVVLHNGRGTIVWNKEQKKWNKI